MKHCNNCDTTKSIDDFHKNKTTYDGRVAKCKECLKADNKAYRESHPDYNKDYGKKYRELNPYPRKTPKRTPEEQRIQKRLRSIEWRKKNRDKNNSYSAKRKAAKAKRLPIWITPEDISAIEDIYANAQKLTKLTGIQFHVDHIVPLQGENVSGLHIPANLQLLTQHENNVKYNTY